MATLSGSHFGMSAAAAATVGGAAIVAAEENDERKDDNPGAVVIEKTAKAVVHKVFSFRGALCPLDSML